MLKPSYKMGLVALLSGGLYFLFAYQLLSQLDWKAPMVEPERVLGLLAQDVASDIDHYLSEKRLAVQSFAQADVILENLQSSNAEFDAMQEGERHRTLAHLNTSWVAATDVDDPFVKARMSSPMARYLARVVAGVPEEYGEIFVTNRYGLALATTNKLTTLTHAQKYWWRAAYNEGKGRVFYDDRGFDQSVRGYVIGIVVPIMVEGEVLGILKTNINMIGGLSRALWEGVLHQELDVSLVRSGGLVVLRRGVKPLSMSLMEEELGEDPLVGSVREVTYQDAETGQARRYLMAQAPVSLSLGSMDAGFGGKYRSIDQYKGNEGESWMVLTKKSLDTSADAGMIERQLVMASGLLLVVFVLLAMWVGRAVNRP